MQLHTYVVARPWVGFTPKGKGRVGRYVDLCVSGLFLGEARVVYTVGLLRLLCLTARV